MSSGRRWRRHWTSSRTSWSGSWIGGTVEPVFYQGKRVGEKLRFSDALLMFRLRALRPERYRDNYQGDGKEREVYVIEPPVRMSMEEHEDRPSRGKGTEAEAADPGGRE